MTRTEEQFANSTAAAAASRTCRVQGARPDDPSVKAVASFVIAVCDGLAVQWVLDPDELPTGEELRSGVRTVWDRSHHTEQ